MIFFLASLEWVLGYILSIFFKKRLLLEREHQSVGFKKNKADYCFEFSSEGEFSRIRFLVREKLLIGKRVELIFSSPSVIDSIIKIKKEFPELIEYKMYPFFDRKISLKNWISADHLALVRYDFFPNLFKIGQRKSEFVLYSATAKKLDHKFYAYLFGKFSKIYAASPKQAKLMSERLGQNIDYREFRVNEIEQRVKRAPEVLLKYFESLEVQNGIILGSSWLRDFKESEVQKLINNKRFKNVFIFLHDISESTEVSSLLSEVQVIDQYPAKLDLTKRFIIINIRGILCEFYTLCNSAYVGGGYGDGLHSVLEPFLAGCKEIFGGPHNKKSIEKEFLDDRFIELN